MALNPTRLSAAIYTLWTTNGSSGLSSPLSTAQQAIIRAQCDAIAQAVITEFVTNAVVATADVGTATGAMGGGPGVPTVGTGTGTVS